MNGSPLWGPLFLENMYFVFVSQASADFTNVIGIHTAIAEVVDMDMWPEQLKARQIEMGEISPSDP